MSEASSPFEGRLRVRVGALVIRADAILLVQHTGLWDDRPFWTPPGGGVEFGESLPEALKREAAEETGLDVEVGPLRYALDFVRPPLHAVSFYFGCTPLDPLQEARTGSDPEWGEGDQIIRHVRWVPLAELGALNLYPEGLAGWLARDLSADFRDTPRYLGTLR